MENRLNPCPFCGKTPSAPRYLSDEATYKQVGRALEHVERHEVWIIQCGIHATIYGPSPEKATEAWNRRINKRQEKRVHDTKKSAPAATGADEV